MQPGTSLVLPGPGMTPDAVLTLIQDHRVTVAAGVPTIWMGLLPKLGEYDCSSLRILLCGGSAVPKSMSEGFRTAIGLPLACAALDDEAAQRSRIFVDRRESAFDGVGDILQPIASGAIKESDVLGDHYDLAGGKVKGRLSDSDITFFKNAGGGHLDLMTCETVLAQLGKELR